MSRRKQVHSRFPATHPHPAPRGSITLTPGRRLATHIRSRTILPSHARFFAVADRIRSHRCPTRYGRSSLPSPRAFSTRRSLTRSFLQMTSQDFAIECCSAGLARLRTLQNAGLGNFQFHTLLPETSASCRGELFAVARQHFHQKGSEDTSLRRDSDRSAHLFRLFPECGSVSIAGPVSRAARMLRLFQIMLTLLMPSTLEFIPATNLAPSNRDG